MITVACVEVGNYQGCGHRYVKTLRNSVARNLGPHRFVCLSDREHPGIETIPVPSEGWWSKRFLFAPNLFQGRVLFTDLDNLIVGPLEELVAKPGLPYLTDWGWSRHVYCSTVMVWDAGDHEEIYSAFTPDVIPRVHGDQDWITECSQWDRMKPGLVRSYRYECKQGPRRGTAIVAMHGKDKPHLFKSGWVLDFWR